MLINKFDSAKRCTYETIEWMDSENQSHVINCSYKDDNSDLLMSKGLLTIAKELNLIDKNTLFLNYVNYFTTTQLSVIEVN